MISMQNGAVWIFMPASTVLKMISPRVHLHQQKWVINGFGIFICGWPVDIIDVARWV